MFFFFLILIKSWSNKTNNSNIYYTIFTPNFTHLHRLYSDFPSLEKRLLDRSIQKKKNMYYKNNNTIFFVTQISTILNAE